MRRILAFLLASAATAVVAPPGLESRRVVAQSLDTDLGASRLLRARLGPAPERLIVTSTAFSSRATIDERFTEYGDRLSPPIAWSGQPSDTESFAIVMEDPDARPPLSAPYVHWVVFNLPAGMTSLPAAVPGRIFLREYGRARQGTTSYGSVGYLGPRPPAGEPAHRYHIQVFALDRQLFLIPGANRDDLMAAMRGHVLADGEIVAMFERIVR